MLVEESLPTLFYLNLITEADAVPLLFFTLSICLPFHLLLQREGLLSRGTPAVNESPVV